MKKIVIGVVILLFILIISLLALFSPPKLTKFIEKTDLKFPDKTKMISSIDKEYLSGEIQIPIESIELFLKENKFFNRTDDDIYKESACVHDGKNKYEFKLNLKTGEMNINVFSAEKLRNNLCEKEKN